MNSINQVNWLTSSAMTAGTEFAGALERRDVFGGFESTGRLVGWGLACRGVGGDSR